MIQQVKGYRSTDGQIFTDRVQAMGHEVKINLRGILQSTGTRVENLTTSQAAAILFEHQDKVLDVFHKYKKSLSNMRRTKIQNAQ